MNKYNQLREEIIRYCPDILDLVFGCKVASENGYFTIGGEAEIDIVYKGTPHERIYLITYGRRTDDFKIIGREITLFDIKQCLIYNGYTTKEFCEIAELWEKPNSLDEQSNELKEKLYEYIKNKNG